MPDCSDESTRSSPVFTIVLANVLLALVALVREAVLSGLLGTTRAADAFFLALHSVDVQANLILSTSLLSAAIPVLSIFIVSNDSAAFRRAMNSMTGAVALGSMVLWAVNASAASRIMEALGAGLSEPARRAAVKMFFVMLPSIPCFALFGLFSACLNARSSFGPPAFGPVVLNLVFITGSALTMHRLGALSLPVWFTVGAVAMVSLQIVALKRTGMVPWPRIDLRVPGLREFFLLAATVGGAHVLGQVGYMVERMLASGFGEGGVSSLTYAFKVSQTPLWVFVAAFSTVAFPELARAAESGDRMTLSGVLEQSIRLTVFVTFPLAIVLSVFARQVIALLLMRGAFLRASLDSTSQVLRGYALAPLSQGFAYLFLRTSYALRDAVGVALAAAVGSAVMILVDLVAVPHMGPPALGVGAAIGFSFSAATMAIRVGRHLDRGIWVRLREPIIRVAACCVPMLTVMWVFGCSWMGSVEAMAEWRRLLYVGLMLCLGFLTYLATCVAAGVEEASRLVRLFKSERMLSKISFKG